MENFISVDGTPTRYLGTIEPAWQGVLDFKAVTIIDSTQADVIRGKQRERVISSRLVLRWKETDTGYKSKARWCVHGFKDPDIHEIARSCPTPRAVVHQLYTADPGVDNVRRDVGRRGESIHAR